MKSTSTLRIALVLLLASMLTTTFNIQPIKAEPTTIGDWTTDGRIELYVHSFTAEPSVDYYPYEPDTVGYIFAWVDLSLKNVGIEKVSTNRNYAYLKDTKNYVYEAVSVLSPKAWRLMDLPPGETLRGEIYWEVPPEAMIHEFIWHDYWSYISIIVSEFPSLDVFLTLNPTTIGSEGEVSVNVHATAGKIAIENAYVQLVSDRDGDFTTSSDYTDSNGDFSATFTAPSVSEETNVRITATASKSGYTDGSGYEYVRVLPPEAASLSVTVTINPSTVKSGETSSIMVQVTDGVNPVPGATVTLYSDKGGFSSTSGNTDSNGYFTTTFTAPTVTTQTTITITANATKTGYLDGQGQTQITVNPSQPPQDGKQPDLTLWVYLAILVIILLTIGGGVAIARRKRRKPKEEPISRL